jgi:hypothetical protein
MSKKSLLKSRTFWAITLTAVVGIAPGLADAIDKGSLKFSTFIQLLGVGSGSVLGILGRIYAEDRVFTAPGLPGANREDLPN